MHLARDRPQGTYVRAAERRQFTSDPPLSLGWQINCGENAPAPAPGPRSRWPHEGNTADSVLYLCQGTNVMNGATDLDTTCVNTVRTLSMDAVQEANSRHPGTPAEEVIRPGGGPMFNQSHLRWLATSLLRLALAISFLSAVADRFGLWGQFGTAGVAWGDFERFTAYTARLLWFLPPSLVGSAGILATGAELILAGGLLVGWRLHWWAFAAAALLLSFALTMSCALGVKAPLDYSVWTAAGAAFLLGVVALQERGTGHAEPGAPSNRPPE